MVLMDDLVSEIYFWEWDPIIGDSSHILDRFNVTCEYIQLCGKINDLIYFLLK